MFLRLAGLFRPAWFWLLAGCLLALVALFANIALMATSGWFIAAMGLAGAAGGSMNYFAPAALIRLFAILRTGGRYAERLATHEATFRVISGLKVWIYRRMEPLAPPLLAAFASGDLASRLRADIDRLEGAYLKIFLPFCSAFCVSILVPLWLARYDRSLGWLEAGALIAAGWVLPALLGRWTARLAGRSVALQTALTERAVGLLQGMGEILIFQPPGWRAGFMAESHALTGNQRRLGRLAGLNQASLSLGANLALWGSVVLAVPLVADGRMAPPDLVLTALLALAAFEAVAPLPAAFQAMGAVGRSAGRIFALADAGNAGDQANPAGLMPIPSADRLDFRLEAMTFRYSGTDRMLFEDLTLCLGTGRRVALVGPPGVGKTTLVYLLAGLLHPTAGRVTLAGQALDRYDGEALRACLAVAPQMPSLFTGTVRQNLLLGHPAAAESDLWRVLEIAQLAPMVAALPGGLDCALGAGGMTLSGGEARRLSVARALLKPAGLLILDEPGEGLDTATETALMAAVIATLDGRGLLLITHRTAGLALMDEVVRLDG